MDVPYCTIESIIERRRAVCRDQWSASDKKHCHGCVLSYIKKVILSSPLRLVRLERERERARVTADKIR